jgi:hypothetical protein
MAHATLADHIVSYPHALTTAQCRELIDRFEASDHQEVCRREGGHSFTQINLSQHWPRESALLSEVFQACLSLYQAQVGAAFWPVVYAFENFRMKRYLPNGVDAFPVHVDVMGQAAARRFMTAILYLNAPQGGETVFPQLGVSIAPEPGRWVAFPPLWMFPHEGRAPLDQPKYIVHSYMCYPV